MIGRARVGADEYPVYADYRDMRQDYLGGVIGKHTMVIYRNHICEVFDIFTDEDGDQYNMLIPADGAGFGAINFTIEL